jgi:hypothetical protein
MPAISRRVVSGTDLPAVSETALSFGSCLRRSEWWWSRYFSAYVTFRIAERRKLVSVIYQKKPDQFVRQVNEGSPARWMLEAAN